MKHTAPRDRRKAVLIAAGAGVAVTAMVTAAAAGLGGLLVERIGAEDGVVADPFSDGVTVSWGEPAYDATSKGYVVDSLTVSRNGVTQLADGSFAELRDSTTTGVWFSNGQTTTNGGEVTVGEHGLDLFESATDGAPNAKASALYYTGVIPLSDLELGDGVRVEYRDLTAADHYFLAQIPVYVGPDAGQLDIVGVGAGGQSPIFTTNGAPTLGSVLHPVSNYTQSGGVYAFDETTVFRLMPPNHAEIGFDDVSTNDWRGTIGDFLTVYPDAVTPGLWVSLSSNSTDADISVTVTDVAFGDGRWSFQPAPAVPAGDLHVTVADEDGIPLAEGTATTDGTTNAITFALDSSITVDAIQRVAVVLHGVD